MRIGVDTNILWSVTGAAPGAYSEKDDLKIKNLFSRLISAGNVLCVTFQNLAEYYAVATRPRSVGGAGLSPIEAVEQVQMLRRQFEVLPDKPETIITFLSICAEARVVGKQTHDARLAAAFLESIINTIVTVNAKHFLRFRGLNVITPQDSEGS